ncbi:hypothetical protein D3C87_715970 [compost metagenome]
MPAASSTLVGVAEILTVEASLSLMVPIPSACVMVSGAVAPLNVTLKLSAFSVTLSSVIGIRMVCVAPDTDPAGKVITPVLAV